MEVGLEVLCGPVGFSCVVQKVAFHNVVVAGVVKSRQKMPGMCQCCMSGMLHQRKVSGTAPSVLLSVILHSSAITDALLGASYFGCDSYNICHCVGTKPRALTTPAPSFLRLPCEIMLSRWLSIGFGSCILPMYGCRPVMDPRLSSADAGGIYMLPACMGHMLGILGMCAGVIEHAMRQSCLT